MPGNKISTGRKGLLRMAVCSLLGIKEDLRKIIHMEVGKSKEGLNYGIVNKIMCSLRIVTLKRGHFKGVLT